MSSTSSVSISQAISQATIGGGVPPGKITMGHGEYIVFHQSADGLTSEVSKETYEEVYAIFMRNSPAAIINNGGTVDDCVNRYELIKSQIKELDPTLEAVFVPRTLYELIFIRKCIEEDLQEKSVCSLVAPGSHGDKRPKHAQEKAEIKAEYVNEGKCWHFCYFEDAGDNEHSEVKEMAYRLNKVMVDTLFPTSEGFTYDEIAGHAEKEIEFLKAQHKIGVAGGHRVYMNGGYPGPAINFCFEEYSGSKPMGIRNDADADIISNTVELECSMLAQKSFFLFRGSNQKDLPYNKREPERPYSLSYGTSLFAGCVHDGGATAFHFIRDSINAYAISIPFDQLNSSPFCVPTTNAIAQLNGNGETFHGRSRAWAGLDPKRLGGFNWGTDNGRREHLASDLSREVFIAQFDQYMYRATKLK